MKTRQASDRHRRPLAVEALSRSLLPPELSEDWVWHHGVPINFSFLSAPF